jgi:hypothetical protein
LHSHLPACSSVSDSNCYILFAQRCKQPSSAAAAAAAVGRIIAAPTLASSLHAPKPITQVTTKDGLWEAREVLCSSTHD